MTTLVQPHSAQRRLWALLAILAICRLAAAAFVPLTEDEAYYRMWALHPSFGYYDHPPMIAWWIALGRVLAGDDSLGVRLLPALSGLLSTVFVYRTVGARAGSAPQALKAAIWFNAMPLVGLGGFLATPDAPATLFWAMTIWALVAADRFGSKAGWIVAGLGAGLCLLSKYSGFFLFPGVLLWLLVAARGRVWLRTAWPWIAAALALAVFAPNVAWNAGHGWMTFQKQFGRIGANALRPGFLLEAVALQVVLISPFMLPFVARGFAGLSRRSGAAPAYLHIVALTSLPLIAYMALHALHARVQGNWPAPIYPNLAMLAAYGVELGGGRALRTLARIVAPFGFGVPALVLAHVALPQTDMFGSRDPVSQVRGWRDLADDVDVVRNAAGAAWVGTDSYGATAQLSYALRGTAPVIEISERDRYQFEASQRSSTQGPGLIVDLQRRLQPDKLARCFGEVRDKGVFFRSSNGRQIKAYHLYLVTSPKVDILRDGCVGLRPGAARDGPA